jgi:hypothetical protein
MKKIAAAVSLAFGMGVVMSAHSAVPVPIDPDGGAAANGTIQVGNLDWSVGNALAVGVVQGSPVGTAFTTYAQASLSNFNNIANNPISVTGLNTVFEWTYVTGFQEVITSSTNGGQALQFQVNPNNLGLNATQNFFQIYRSAPNSDDLAGTGFNDGTLVLTGHILQGATLGESGFTAAGNVSGPVTAPIFTPTISALDQFGGNDYGTITSINGTGSSKISIRVDSLDTATFLGLAVRDVFTLEFNTSQILAYNQTDPSACFWTGAAVLGGAGGGGCANTIGTQNGVSGPNIMFQTDANNSFNVARVPEPGVLALLGISLLGLGIARTRRS